jgi:hypothetical protein
MSEHTPHDSESTSASDPWAEATDDVRPDRGAAPHADTDQARDAARAEQDAARAEQDAARTEDDATRAEAGRTPTPEQSVREILADVAAGKLTPEAAAPLIDAARESGGATTAGDTGTTEMPGAGTAGPGEEAVPVAATTNRLRIRAVGRRVRIIGEPFVSTVAVDGPHVVRQEGDTLVVTSEGEFGASIDGFTLMRSRTLRDVQERVFDIGRELSVRVNPSLAVEVEVTAGSVNAERLPALEQVRVTAGSARVRDVDGPIDLLVQAGSAQVEGKITKGRSRLRAESGSLQLRLLPGSSVRVRPDVQLGRVQWEPPGKDREEHIVGLGDAILNLEVVMGTATVKEAP